MRGKKRMNRKEMAEGKEENPGMKGTCRENADSTPQG
jgi:hypothetical protein